MLNSILHQIAFVYEESANQNNTFTPYHTRYDCVIKYGTNGKPYEFTYQCNPNHMTPNITDVMDSLLLDASSYEGCDDIYDFCNEFGYDIYEDEDKYYDIYNACKRTSEALHEMFTSDEIEEIFKEIEESY